MKIELPQELREAAQRLLATLNPGLSQAQVLALPDDFLVEPADTLGRILDFYLSALERGYAATNESFYGDWQLATEAARRTPAYLAVLMLRVLIQKKRNEKASAGNLQHFRELFTKALQGQINLYDPLQP